MGLLTLTVTDGCFVRLSVLFKEVALKLWKAKNVLHAALVISSASAPKQAVLEQRLAQNKSVRGAHEECLESGHGQAGPLPGVLVFVPPVLAISACF